MNTLYYRTRVWEMLTPEYVSEMAKRFHFNEKDIPLIESVARDIRGCIKDQETLEIVLAEGYADVAITLGSNLDILLDKYSRQGRLLEQLAAENLISDILMRAYNQVADIIRAETGLQVSGYHFWGSEDGMSLDGMLDIISQFTRISISCTKDYLLKPSKSVVYRVDLSSEGCGHVPSASICETCPNPCENKIITLL